MSEQTPPQPLPAAVQAQNPAEKPRPYAELVEHLLRPGTLKDVSPEQEGEVIVDRFIGQLARSKGVVDAEGRLGAGDALLMMDRITNLSRQKGGIPFEKGLTFFTRNEGLREAVSLLADDRRTGQFFGDMLKRIGITDKGEPTLHTLSQIEGYLYADVKTPEGAQTTANWQDTVMSRISDYVTGRSAEPAWKLKELAGADAEGIKNRQMAWEQAAASARSVGVDMELIQRSAEETRALHERQADVGTVALQGALPNYDQMFK